MSSESTTPTPVRPGAVFATTRWSIVLAAGHASVAGAENALADLCRSYWYPLYAFARRQGRGPEDAADLTQAFFADLMENSVLKSADPQRGRFRSYLLTVFKRFLSRDTAREQAQKRGGGRALFSIDVDAGERRYQFEPTDNWTAEMLYQRRWAFTLLDDVMRRLESEYADKEKTALFNDGKLYLTASSAAPPQAETAESLGMSAAAFRVAVHRLRSRYKELLQEAVAQTLGPEESVEDEIARLRAALRGKI